MPKDILYDMLEGIFRLEFIEWFGRINLFVVVLFAVATVYASRQCPKGDYSKTFLYACSRSFLVFCICLGTLLFFWFLKLLNK